MTAWSRERPMEPGWYWFVEYGWSEPEAVHVKEVSAPTGPVMRVYFTSGRREDLSTVAGEFQGPLEPKE